MREKFLLPETCIVASLRLADASSEEIVRRPVGESASFSFPRRRCPKASHACAREDSICLAAWWTTSGSMVLAAR